mgnify:CR=1 FL=1
MNSVVIRADASPTIGAGHQMRCLALAQAIGEIGGQAIFSMVESLPLVEKRLQDEAIQMMKITAKPGSAADAAATIAIANNYEAKWIVADGYYFGVPFQQRVKSSGHNLLSIDDDASSRHYCSDIIVNQNISAPALDYSARETYTEMLLGTRYALLRRDFLHPPRSTCSSPPTATNILVTLGGGDAMGAIETRLLIQKRQLVGAHQELLAGEFGDVVDNEISKELDIDLGSGKVATADGDITDAHLVECFQRKSHGIRIGVKVNRGGRFNEVHIRIDQVNCLDGSVDRPGDGERVAADAQRAAPSKPRWVIGVGVDAQAAVVTVCAGDGADVDVAGGQCWFFGRVGLGGHWWERWG